MATGNTGSLSEKREHLSNFILICQLWLLQNYFLPQVFRSWCELPWSGWASNLQTHNNSKDGVIFEKSISRDENFLSLFVGGYFFYEQVKSANSILISSVRSKPFSDWKSGENSKKIRFFSKNLSHWNFIVLKLSEGVHK